jgi:thioredoxin 1
MPKHFFPFNSVAHRLKTSRQPACIRANGGVCLTTLRLSDTFGESLFCILQEDGMVDIFTQITEENFAAKVTKAEQTVLVLFYKEGSNSCDIQIPELEAVNKEYQERVIFARVDVDEQAKLTQQWQVDAVPTLVFFRNGNEIYRIKGIRMRDKLRRQLEGVLLTS